MRQFSLEEISNSSKQLPSGAQVEKVLALEGEL
jgi:hypothetical protein